MFQAFDSPGKPLGRANWMALLARAPLGLLESALHEHAAGPARWLRAPETGLMMVQGRVGGTGERFHLGEVSVTRCALRVGVGADAVDAADAAVGVAYVLGRSHRHAQLAALADALLQDPAQKPALDARLLEPIRCHLRRAQAARQARAASTKVDFFTVAREGGADSAQDAQDAQQ
ncbi:phosphonate C-P lyase system protein PhnG [Verminephrobacter aporrectodeae]|uniref:phosphonate C-P lyase system protein PhnG n=1 Tax=Verminephrobacter aporrectodeae TaxID=1110389 RepID=UPI00224429EB|nr:phosphonate C-P lyase system protein PhnG [Verminephrobacter aporrectodeae]MCW8175323.1 phosphonate C-P lyase system protein PhnG [Verminephrobacter aporrectodeae subsp. tuberculatae]MCW8202851.1 phosphonate C-P lyase system protein PhnG [Verminephrobacter aporrectodeae subsp. tuberculatae]